MRKNLPITILLMVILTVFSSFIISLHKPFFSSAAPTGFTGATGGYCIGCHGGNALNSAGGSVSVSGLPTGSYTAGTAYNFSITSTHSAANRGRWGFAIAARNSAGVQVGTFSTTNPNASVNGNELGHSNAVATALQSSYTYNNLTWTAPAAPGPNDANITFYYTGNAANGTGSTAGDFIYAGSISNVVLPVTLSYFEVIAINKNNTQLKWRTESEQNTDYFSIQRSEDGQRFNEIEKMGAAGNSTITKQYIFTDNIQTSSMRFAYYRIVTVDIDGKKTYSSIKYVALSSKETFVRLQSPNPVRAGNTVQFNIESDAAQNVFINVVALNGKQLLAKSIRVNKGNKTFNMEIPALWSNSMVTVAFTINKKVQQLPLLISSK